MTLTLLLTIAWGIPICLIAHRHFSARPTSRGIPRKDKPGGTSHNTIPLGLLLAAQKSIKKI